tara:strand:- start:233 stop:532 length:300 start_codon:yes stop_codon:yes gene_type:complete
MNTDLLNNEKLITKALPKWHVWVVEDHFIAAVSLESAIECYCGDWGVARDEVCYDETHSDNVDYYDTEEDENPTTVMRIQAENLMDGGSVMPFDFARAE